MSKTPAELGFYFPAEWEHHEAIFLSWPHDRITFPNIDGAEKVYVEMIRGIRGSEKVYLMVADEEMRQHVLSLLAKNGVQFDHVKFFIHEYADVWFRDYGPTFVVNREKKQIAMTKWTFNAWGGKYPSLMKDDDVPAFLNESMNLPFFPAGIVMEGGALEVNGKGTLLTTTQCLLNKNRNPSLSKEQIEQVLKNYIGVSNIIWLNDGIIGDDTDAHIDNLARFVSETTVLCAFEENKDDENYSNLKENYDILCASKDQEGNQLNVIKMPLPRLEDDERRYPASYMNFYIGNTVVLAPIYDDKNDEHALAILRNCFPNKTVVGINCVNLVTGSGAIHCVSQQLPSV